MAWAKNAGISVSRVGRGGAGSTTQISCTASVQQQGVHQSKAPRHRDTGAEPV